MHTTDGIENNGKTNHKFLLFGIVLIKQEFLFSFMIYLISKRCE